MFNVLQKLKRTLKNLDYLRETQHLALEQLSPVDRYCALNASRAFTSDYVLWRVNRISKVLEILGMEWDWPGKTFLELGSGFGEIGAFFADAGAEVVSVDGRAENLIVSKLRFRQFPNMSFALRNLETDFSDLGRFDVIIHFGLLYHIHNVELNLRNCAAMTDRLFLETVVLDSLDDEKIDESQETTGSRDSGISGKISMPSPFYIKKILEDCGMTVDIISDRSLNCERHVYDWDHKNDGSWVQHRRRFFYARRET